MPRPTKSDQDEEDQPVRRVNLTAPIRKCTLEPDKKHPQRLVMIEREKQKPSTNLDSWFETGLMRQVVEGDEKNPNAQSFVTGSKPLPPGYGGCDAEKSLVVALESGILMWPIRPAICDGICDKKPWTLYHYTHRASFEQFHKRFHAMGSVDEDDTHRQLYHILQADYQERTPNPSNINVKGEPMLTTLEPAKFQNKAMVLQHVFGKEATGHSKQGNPYDQFADYCIAFLVPGSACFQTVNQASGANVRFCKDTLEILMKRAHMQAEEARRKTRKAEEAEHDEEAVEEKAVGCLARLCGRGPKRPEKAEFWDEVEGPKDKHKKKDREMDRWKQRMAKRWLEEHVSECAKHTAQESKVKDAEDRRSAEETAKAESDYKHANQKSQTMEVNRRKTASFNLGISRTFTKMLDQFSNAKAEKAADAGYLSTASKEVEKASSLFHQYGKRQSGDDLEDHEARAADENLKRMRRSASAQEEKALPTGTKRRVVHKKNRKNMEIAKAVEYGSMPSEAMDKLDTDAWREVKEKKLEAKWAKQDEATVNASKNAHKDVEGDDDTHEENQDQAQKQPGKRVSISSSSPDPSKKEGSSEASESPKDVPEGPDGKPSSPKEASAGAEEASGDDEETKKASEADSASEAATPSEGGSKTSADEEKDE